MRGQLGAGEGHMADIGTYLKKHTEALVKDVGIEAACQITGKSKATLGRYYSENAEHADRFIPVDAVARLEGAASFPHVTWADQLPRADPVAHSHAIGSGPCRDKNSHSHHS